MVNRTVQVSETTSGHHPSARARSADAQSAGLGLAAILVIADLASWVTALRAVIDVYVG